jgi:hypothetical protein
MMNSVYAPGSVSTSILPPCCFTMMSWLIESASRCPRPPGTEVSSCQARHRRERSLPVSCQRSRVRHRR